jgi:hypothetical protein
LHDNTIEDIGISHLAKRYKAKEICEINICSLMTSHIRQFNVKDNSISNTGACDLFQSIKYTSSLQKLSIHGNSIGSTAAVATALGEMLCGAHLNHLCISTYFDIAYI